ncbi:hypothetical protein ACIBSW_40445 [Actinoplanes sp. NPDC049668]|uniref:hypothetical protein n=1 Tax=unclassified Actinoplanes TaxID=2626549 RepID=UPI00339F58FC
MTRHWYAEKMPTGAFRTVAVSASARSSVAEELFANLIDDFEPKTPIVIRSDFARRTNAVRTRMALCHELGHVLLGGAKAAGAPIRLEMPTGIGKTAIFASVVQVLRDVSTTTRTLSTDASCSRSEDLYRSLQARYPILLSSEQPNRSRKGTNLDRPGAPDRATLRDLARSLTKAVLATAPGRMGTRFLTKFRRLVTCATRLLQTPDPAEPPGQLMTARRRPTRGPSYLRTCKYFVRGVAIA